MVRSARVEGRYSLIATGVSFSLYIINRFVEEKGDSRADRAIKAVVRINPAIFLSAVATGIGFFALMIGTLPPIWSLGLALSIGIAAINAWNRLAIGFRLQHPGDRKRAS